MHVTYVSEWDGGTKICTKAEYDPQTKNVTNIESSDADGLDVLEREYIELPDGTEIDRTDFLVEGEPAEA